eukprot:CAMPEP_0113594298 /NCGR_PEP_ID=MMETSP0015_2-20120614/38977_1 /TAXON_ID=2838 /ORGANISM="Odontella" /LENGTH=136 /DNA_ID=CAMNT_0000501235 /DNA_START=318 /DNA_END=728 /DNA_ORIENTATION=- /assembly_acc=CAM_ASM_000160
MASQALTGRSINESSNRGEENTPFIAWLLGKMSRIATRRDGQSRRVQRRSYDEITMFRRAQSERELAPRDVQALSLRVQCSYRREMFKGEATGRKEGRRTEWTRLQPIAHISRARVINAADFQQTDWAPTNPSTLF